MTRLNDCLQTSTLSLSSRYHISDCHTENVSNLFKKLSAQDNLIKKL